MSRFALGARVAAVVVVAALLSLPSMAPAASASLCEERAGRLQEQTRGVLATASEDVVDLLVGAVEACYGGMPAGNHPAQPVPVPSPARIICDGGTISQLQPLLVMFGAPPLPLTPYVEPANMIYTFDPPDFEAFSAQGPTMGFDATIVGNIATGKVRFGGLLLDADWVGISGMCDRPNRSPCTATGLVGVTSHPLLEVWMRGTIEVCE